jgi:hypothetical protein
MSETNDRIERLEREVWRLRGWILVLAVALLAACALGATQRTPDELTLRKLIIVDGNGKERIGMGTLPDGQARVQHYDQDGKTRIATGTFPDGSASIQHYDQDGKGRIIGGTVADGRAIIGIYDGKERSMWGEVSFK